MSWISPFLLCLLTAGPGRAQSGSPAGPVPPEVLGARRERLLTALHGAVAILSSAGPRGDYAQDSDYREDNDFFYLTGIESPAAWLVVNGGGEGGVTLYLPPREPAAERWTGPTLGPGPEARALTGLSDVRPLEELQGDLRRWLSQDTPGNEGPSGSLLVSLGDPRFEDTVHALLPPGAPEPGSLDPILAQLRLTKDREEIRRLRRAVEITGEAHRELWRVADPGLAEYQLEAVLEYVFRVNGAERVGFPSIVGSGPNSTILHYDANRRVLQDGDLVVVDIGAEFGYYTADITRTFPANGRFSPRQASLYELVLGARAAGLEVIGPGATMADVNQAVRSFLLENSGDLCGPEACARFLIHGVAHWLGMDVHDVGSSSAPFAAGMVLTLEPGLYIPEEMLGIRVEDDILVTERGYEVLSEDLPRTVREIEAIMEEAPRWVGAPPGVGRSGGEEGRCAGGSSSRTRRPARRFRSRTPEEPPAAKPTSQTTIEAR
jgi:Xaa-Pro aminopeptidase